jgi:Dolichyl-phosphate-mannose-protein mannosyltransferase
LKSVVIVTAAWGLINTLVRRLAGENLAMDDPKLNVFAQTWQFGYLPENPPLFEWILHSVQLLTGPNLASFQILKYTLLIVFAGFLYSSAKRVTGTEKWAALTVWSSILLYQIGWNYHLTLSHSLALIAMTTMSLWAGFRLIERRTITDYAIFGLACGLGLLSKYNFGGFLFVFLFAAGLDPRLRTAMLDVRLLLSFSIAALLFTPHLIWLIGNIEFTWEITSRKLGLEGPYLTRVFDGLQSSFIAILSFFLPFLLFVAAIAPRAFKISLQEEMPFERLCRRSLPISLTLIISGVVIFGIANVSERYVIPFLIPGFLWMMARVKRAISDGPREKAWMSSIIGFAAIVVVLRVVNVGAAGPPFCERCDRWIPYAALQTAIADNGLDLDGIYVGYEENTAGNLRRFLPDASIRAGNMLFYNPVHENNEMRACYFVWSEELLGQPVEDHYRYIAESPQTINVDAIWHHPMRESGWRHTHWGISPVPLDSPFYAEWCLPGWLGER